jgi:hypothetical protein
MENKQQPPTKIGKTWFIQRGNNPDDIFACEEQECWGLLQNKSNWRRNDFKIVGVSDGQTYVKMLKESQSEVSKVQQEVELLSKDLTRYLDTRDNFKFKELLPETDDKMVRVSALIKELQDKIDEKSIILKDAQQYIVNKAFKAELDIARGNIEYPANFDVITPHGNRDKILRELGK